MQSLWTLKWQHFWAHSCKEIPYLRYILGLPKIKILFFSLNSTIYQKWHDDWKPWYVRMSVLCLCVCISHPAAKRRVCGWGTCLFSKPHAKLLTGSESCQGESPKDNSTDHNICVSQPYTHTYIQYIYRYVHTHTSKHTHTLCPSPDTSRNVLRWRI